MGAMLVGELKSGAYPGLELAGGSILPHEKSDGDFFVTSDPQELFNKSDAIIDFTVPNATRTHIEIAAKTKKTLVIGTTGLSPEIEAEINGAAKHTRLVYAANYSVGVNVALALVERAAAILRDDWDIEIFEAHHKHKIDAPSGTALALGKSAQKGRGEGKFVTDREGKRTSGDIGFSVARGGDVVGEHRVVFYGEGERVEINHVATNRALFARGAIRAAQWVQSRPNGLYTMRDVLGL